MHGVERSRRYAIVHFKNEEKEEEMKMAQTGVQNSLGSSLFFI